MSVKRALTVFGDKFCSIILEFIEVGKKEPALDALYDVIKSKKHRTWQNKIHEPILFKYLELCVDLRRSHVAKEGLYQYKLICQQVNIVSLEDVIRYFLKLAEDRADAARQESRDQVPIVEDLDQIQTPERYSWFALCSLNEGLQWGCETFSCFVLFCLFFSGWEPARHKTCVVVTS